MQQKKDEPLPYLERLPNIAASENPPLVILLHGRAAKAQTIFSIEGFLDPAFHIISIEAPYKNEKGDFEWFLPYDYDRPLESFSEEHFTESEEILTKQIKLMIEERSVPSEHLFLGGFSQGAAMCHILSMRRNLASRGVLAMSGFFPRPIVKWSVPTSLPSYLITHGANDKILSTNESRLAFDFYKSIHADVEYYEYNGRHKMTPPLLEKINNWVRSKNQRS